MACYRSKGAIRFIHDTTDFSWYIVYQCKYGYFSHISGAGVTKSEETFADFIKHYFHFQFSRSTLKLYPEHRATYSKIEADPVFWEKVALLQKEID